MERIIHITSGRGPAECCLFVARLLKEFLKAVDREGGKAEVLNRETGPLNGTLMSAMVRVSKVSESFYQQWEGSLLWICKSPYRRFHKRKNWYIGVFGMEYKPNKWSSKDFTFQTLRASGPGGQHVNKTESAVRALHAQSGLSVLASDSRSQYQNKQLAVERLQHKLYEWELEQLSRQKVEGWNNHNNLERGNPIRIYEGDKFLVKKR
ncbi:peptide chain release factor H [Marinilabiliaceae bacterium JC017]|nr:peptide chain release factor H [Marinilabiliaceae bacterium JC017]